MAWACPTCGTEFEEAGLRALSTAERRVLQGLVNGYSPARIAERLVVSPHTIRTQIGAIYAKLDVHTQVEAVLYGLRNGMEAEPDEAEVA